MTENRKTREKESSSGVRVTERVPTADSVSVQKLFSCAGIICFITYCSSVLINRSASQGSFIHSLVPLAIPGSCYGFSSRTLSMQQIRSWSIFLY